MKTRMVMAALALLLAGSLAAAQQSPVPQTPPLPGGMASGVGIAPGKMEPVFDLKMAMRTGRPSL